MDLDLAAIMMVVNLRSGNPNQIFKDRGISSAGRAPALQAGGQRFDPAILHQAWMFSVWGNEQVILKR